MKPHTAAPWIVAPSSNPKNGTDWRDILSIGGKIKGSYVGEALEKDAYLIAAAPKMLAALEVVAGLLQPHHAKEHDDTPLFEVNGCPLTFGHLRHIKRLIAKAKVEV